MPIVEQIDKDMVAAMKQGEALRVSALRLMKAALKYKQVELGHALDDSEAVAVLRTQVKQRHDSIEQFRKGNREDLVQKEEAEIGVIEAYLPAMASDEELTAAVSAAIAETGAAGREALGKVMKAAMAKLAGKNADGKRVSEIARSKLGG